MRQPQNFILFFPIKTFTEVFGSFFWKFLVNYKKSRNFAEKLNRNIYLILKQMAKIVTLGEIMLRLSPMGNDRFIQSESFRIIPGGGEANVAVSVANYGHEAYFVSKLPKHEIGQIAVNALRRYGVNTQFIARGGDRVGLYYAETGASMRPSKVIYDRAHSSIAEADPKDFDFDAIMEGAAWFHWSGITPAISDKAAELTKLACEAAKRHGVTVSVDLNFRKKLWTSE